MQATVPTAPVVNAYVNGGRLVALHRLENGELEQSSYPAEYAVFVKVEQFPKIERAMRSSRSVRSIRREGDYYRICFDDYDSRDRAVAGKGDGKGGFFRLHGVDVYEGDLSPVRRWLSDARPAIQNPRAGYFDLEWDSRVPFARKGEARCLCWSIVTASGERYGGSLESFDAASERELWLDFFHELQHVDQAIAWNGEKADFEYLRERVKALNIPVNLRRWLWLDAMELYRKFNMTASESGDEKASVALERVAESLGIRGKDQRVKGKDAYAWWAAGGERRAALLRYCVEDSATMVRIEEKTGYVAILSTLADTCGVFPDSRGMRGVNFVESFLMRLGAERGVRAPTKLYADDEVADGEKFLGAFVFPTERGLHENVHICDFARLYPSIMQAWNMSPETYVGRSPAKTLAEACRLLEPGVAVCPVTLEQFRTGERGLFAAALDVIVEQRKFWSKKKASLKPGTPEWVEADRRDAAYKIIANTFYGVSGSPWSRYFMRELSESVTQIGVWLIQNTAAAADPDRDFKKDLPPEAKRLWRLTGAVAYPPAEKRPFRTVAGDTDSSFFVGCSEQEFADFVAWCDRELYPSLIAPTGAAKGVISLAFEKSFAWMINVEKKTYAGRLSHFKGKRADDGTKPSIKGLEYKRGDTARLARVFQKEVIDEILRIGRPNPRRGEVRPSDLDRLCERWQRMVLDGAFPFEDAVIAKALRKDLDEYGGTNAKGQEKTLPAHVQIAKLILERGGEVYEGAKVEYVVTDGAKSPMKVAPASDCTLKEVDLIYLWESLVWPAAARVLEAAFPDHLWARWGGVRPLRGVLPGQAGFGWGEREARPIPD